MSLRLVSRVFAMVLPAFILVAFSMDAYASDGKSFQKEWKKVDSLNNAGLPKSALDVVNKILAEAKSAKDDPQYIKAVIYKLKLESDFREDFFNAAIRYLNGEILTADPAAKSVLQSLLGEVYWKYHETNSYRFSDRTELAGEAGDSIQTWSLNRIAREVTRQYLLSVSDATLLKSIPLGNFSVILESTSKENINKEIDPALLPTLYDLLIQRGLDYFTSDAWPGVSRPADAFTIDKGVYLDQPESFTALDFYTPDSASNAYFALKLYQQAAIFHFNDKNPKVLVRFELDRMEYVWIEGTFAHRDSLYLDALKTFEASYSYSPSSADIAFVRASFLNQQGQEYQPLVSAKHKWEIKEAAAICESTIKKYPESDGGKNCKALLAEIRKPRLSITSLYAVVPGKPSLLDLSWKNIPEVFFRYVSISPEEYASLSELNTREKLFKNLAARPVLKSWSVTLPDDGDFQEHSTEVKAPELSPGFYLVLSSSEKSFTNDKVCFGYIPFWSTNISYVSQRRDDGGMDFYVLDRETGKPLSSASVEVFTKSYDYRIRNWETRKAGSYTSDADGFFSVSPFGRNDNSRNLFLRIRYNNDFFATEGFYVYPVDKRPVVTLQQTNFYTDRAIYRPGQTVWFKGIMLDKTGKNYVLATGKPTKVTFQDANWQTVSELEFVTDEYGAFNGSFTAPTGVLTGQMTIKNESGSVAFRVEEYKRPTFEVTFNPVEGNYRLNDMVTVTGKAQAYAGNAIDGATVSFRVIREARFPYWDWFRWGPLPSSPQVEITQGTVKTAPDGSFTIAFSAIPDLSLDPGEKPVFDYRITADVTDMNGETQSGEESVSVGYVSLLIGMYVPPKLDPAADSSFALTATNLDGRSTPADVRVKIELLNQPDRVFIERMWKQPDINLMTREEFHAAFPYEIYGDENNPGTWGTAAVFMDKLMNTGKDSIFRIGSPKPGSYKLTLSATDPFGQPVSSVTYFTVYNPASKEMPVRQMSWYVPLKTSGEPGEKASFLVGSSEDNVNMMYEVRHADTVISKQWLNLSDRQMIVEVPIKESFRGGFSVSFLFVKDNRAFREGQTVSVPYANRKLDIKIETFRDKLLPGQAEEWRIHISDAKKQGVVSSMLASMYDASLDAFQANDWYFNLYQNYYYRDSWNYHDNFRISSGSDYSAIVNIPPYIFRQVDGIDWFNLGYMGDGYRYRVVGGMKNTRGVMEMDMMVESKAMPPSAAVVAEDEVSTGIMMEKTADSSVGVTASRKPVPRGQGAGIRKDFRETAFFYPNLVSDSTGNLVMKFTMPEALTSWKFMGLAYTKQLDYGMIEKELVTRKDLMVFPNAPRFVRLGDTLVFMVKISDLSDKDLSGEIVLSLSNALTLASVDAMLGNTLASKPFIVKKGESTSVAWKFQIPADADLSVLQYRVVATAGSFSDGEEKAIPVLPNRMMVTESLPLPVRGKGTFDFNFEKLAKSFSDTGKDKTLSNYRLTLEFASNPAWYAIQALPSLNQKQYRCADQVFAAFYSNSIAAYIMNSDPKIRAVFQSWKEITPDALKSNLEKNQELKSALLQQTPWVLEATDETQRKQKLGEYFDQNNLRQNLEENLSLLRKMQKPNGGWVWFDGMPESRYVTQEILTGLGELDHMGIKGIRSDASTWNMVTGAINYLDGQLLSDYNDIKKYNGSKMNENHLGSTQVQYLYARSFFTALPFNDPAAKKAFDYFRQQATLYWLSQDLQVQAMIVLALNRLEKGPVTAAILKSLKEKSLHSDEMGMYWAQPLGYYWYQSPVETQALMIAAFDEAGSDTQAVEEMKIWLLKQKQTQDWKTPRATVEACYALLLRGTDVLSQDAGVRIRVGDEKINPEKLPETKAEAGTGYFSMSWPGSEIKENMGKVTVTKSTDGIAWGALYWQYFENLDKITPHETPLKVEKQLFVVSNTPAGPVLEKITSEKPLVTGDRVRVRIVLSSDRDLEFVHMKDMRSAGFEPTETLSGYRYQDGLGYYQSTGDIATNFFFDYLNKGTYVFEYDLKVNEAGDFSNGITSVQCMYAPEFAAHSEGQRVLVK